MKITLEPTGQFEGVNGTRCRIWKGTSDKGALVIAYVAMVGCHEGATPSLRADLAMPLLTRIRESYKGQGVVELAAGLGTAILGAPISVSAMFNSPADSDRIDHHMWAWPLTEIEHFDMPIPCRGAQGFWTWPVMERAA